MAGSNDLSATGNNFMSTTVAATKTNNSHDPVATPKKDSYIHLLIPRAEHLQLKQIALDHETTVSDLIRDALKKHVLPLAKKKS